MLRGKKYLCLFCRSKKFKFQYSNEAKVKPNGYWNCHENVLLFLKELECSLNLRSIDDWNTITHLDIKKLGGNTLLQKFSIYDLKCLGNPNGKLFYSKPKKPAGYWDNHENILSFLDEFKKNFNLVTLNDWNFISKSQLISFGGSGLFRKYSLLEIKCLGFPQGKSLFTEEYDENSNFWDKQENLLFFLDHLRNKLNLTTVEHWNSITPKQINFYGGKRVLKKYSLHKLKKKGAHEFILKSNHSPGFWKDDDNIKAFLNKLQENLSLKTFEDWNLLTKSQIRSFGGGQLCNLYSLYELKCLGFPEGKSKFSLAKKPKGYWNNTENIHNFIIELKEKLNLKVPEDWNVVSKQQIQSLGGNSLLNNFSLFEIKCMGCPEGKSLFLHQPNNHRNSGYWDKRENILLFLEKLKLKLNLQSPKDWDLITTNQIVSFGGGTLLYRYTIYDLKCLGCPEGIQTFSKPSERKSTDYWDNHENIREFVATLKEKYKIHSPNDWERISKSQIVDSGGLGFLSKYARDSTEIHIVVPEISKLENKLRTTQRSSQRWLFLQLQKIFPVEEIVEDFYHSKLSRETGLSIQFDIFLTQRNIAFEYHGAQHYEDISSGFAPIEMYKFRDEEKKKICKNFGITLIIIPYWWDGKLNSLKKTVHDNIQQM